MVKTLTLDEYSVKIGQNAEENDDIIKEASQKATWFHLESFPSCHLIIECPLEDLTSALIYKCALLVKENTKYRSMPNVRVIYTSIKNVTRTSVKGKVITKKTKTLTV